jgi:hypothetical protein
MALITSMPKLCDNRYYSEVDKKNLKLKMIISQAPVAHTCRPSYSGDRDQEDHSSKPAQTNCSQDPISKIPNTKKGWQSGSSGRVPA